MVFPPYCTPSKTGYYPLMAVSPLVLYKLPKGCLITFCPRRHAKILTQNNILFVQYQLFYPLYILV